MDTHTKYMGKFEVTVNNRIKALIKGEILNSSYTFEGNPTGIGRSGKPSHFIKRGLYQLARSISEEEWMMIDGIQKLNPQRGIVIPQLFDK